MRPVALDYQRLPTRPVRLSKRRWVIALAAGIGVGVGAGVAGSMAARWLASPPPQRYHSGPTDSHTISTALDAFKIDTGRCPTAAEGLGAPMDPPPGLAGWNGPYLKTLLTDPWGRPYVYHPPGPKGGGYVVLSVGPDGKEGTADDVP